MTPMIRLVNSIIERAISENASDIHFEPTEGGDGRQDAYRRAASSDHDDPVGTQRIRSFRGLKIMSQLDIVEKRIPQDGRAVMHLKGGKILICVYPPFRPCMEKSGYPYSETK